MSPVPFHFLGNFRYKKSRPNCSVQMLRPSDPSSKIGIRISPTSRYITPVTTLSSTTTEARTHFVCIKHNLGTGALSRTCSDSVRIVAPSDYKVVSANMPGQTESVFVTKHNFGCTKVIFLQGLKERHYKI